MYSRSRKLSTKNRRNSSKTLKRDNRKSLKRNTRKSLKKNTRKTKRRNRVNMRGGSKSKNKDNVSRHDRVQADDSMINKKKLPSWRERFYYTFFTKEQPPAPPLPPPPPPLPLPENLAVIKQKELEEIEYLHDILKNKETLQQYNSTHSKNNVPHPDETNMDYFTDDIQLSRPLGQNIDAPGFVLNPGCYMFVLTISDYMYIYGPCTDSTTPLSELECCKKEILKRWWPSYRVVHPLLPDRDEQLLTAGLFAFRDGEVYVSNNSGHYRPKPFTEYDKWVIEQKLRAKLPPAVYIFKSMEYVDEDEEKRDYDV